MDEYTNQIQEQKRQERAKEVKIVFQTKGDNQHFIVTDDEGNQKYNGTVITDQPDKFDDCSCPSFVNGNNTKAEGSYIATHGFAFQCKHLKAAREQRS